LLDFREIFIEILSVLISKYHIEARVKRYQNEGQ